MTIDRDSRSNNRVVSYKRHVVTMRINCEKIANGEMCKIPDEQILNDLASSHSLSRKTTESPNGTRIVLSNNDGWFGTAMKYDGNDGFILFKKDFSRT